jgi:homoserine kinase
MQAASPFLSLDGPARSGPRVMRAFAPPSMGNVAAGFDVLGAALAATEGGLWGDLVEIRENDLDEFSWTGPYGARLPLKSGDNLVLRARDAFARRLGKPLPPLAIQLHKGLPVSSGLGSSAASIVATLVALNAWFDDALDTRELLSLAGELESIASGTVHFDNVAPCLLGGLCLVAVDGSIRALPFPDDLVWMIIQPDLELPTMRARAVLPAQVPWHVAVSHGQNLGSMIHGLHMKDRDLIRRSLRDLLAEPHRADLVPAFRNAQAAAMSEGAWGCSYSGAGPAMFAIAEENQSQFIAQSMVAAFARTGVPAQARMCLLDRAGARVIR